MARTSLKVALLAFTPDPQEIVAMGARLCYSDADIQALQKGVEARDQSGYIKRLTDMGHLSPIEHCSFSFGIQGASRALLAQITRHRIASFSVQSQRYVSKRNLEGCFPYILPPAIERLGEQAVAEYHQQMMTMQRWYNAWHERLSDAGEPTNEDARFVLPNACETRMIVTMNARELLHFFRLRCCFRAQWEIRALAWEMLRLCEAKAPALFANAGPGCLVGPCPEGQMCCGRGEEVRRIKGEDR
jgi:thymidylate synthase (FAD)